MKSMTGYGRGTHAVGEWEATVQTSSVNRKSLEVSVSMPRAWQWLEPEIGKRVRAVAKRGRVQVAVECDAVKGRKIASIDEEAIDAMVEELGGYARKRGHRFEPDAAFLLQLALVKGEGTDGPGTEQLTELVIPALTEALEAMVGMRAREGTVLAEDLFSRIEELRALTIKITKASEGTVGERRDQLFQRLKQLDLEIDLSDERVLKEIALFADRCDISEELTRLASHLDQFADLCRTDGSVGRTMEFLLQEVSREIHTVGSKANNLEISHFVIEFKNEIERIREQVQNVE
ncbi:MAG: YicC family protein [Verrucomicrobia bacterium]|nr:MAG: YicC family protein [Verrucomicrobiota bacterium]